MKMFDWDDQELANILWGEDREVDDHIVPYPEDAEKKDLPDYGDDDTKKLNEEYTGKKDAGQRETASKLAPDGVIQEKSYGVFASGSITDPQLESPSFATSDIDDNLIDNNIELDIGPEIIRNQQEDKELGELVGNSWANIGSFEDLNRIFSSDEIDGHTSLNSADVLWSSSKDLTRDAALSSRDWEYGALGSSSSQIELNSEFAKRTEYTVGNLALTAEKRYWPKSRPKFQQTTDKITNSALSGNVYSTWPSTPATLSQCDPATAPNFPAGVPSQQWQSRESEPIAYQDFSNTCVNPYAYTHMLKPSNHEHGSTHANSEVCQGGVISFNKPVEITERPMKMTPQEKIEKLRRRQQMRAMLAIQKQQQQLSNPAFCDPGSPNEKDDICTVSEMDVNSVEDTVLYKLQNIITRLDTKTRQCIKDSLYRLAQSATQRQNGSDINAASRSSTLDPEIAKEEISPHHRIPGNPNVETETNHIDRAVAHLLFHRPLKISVKHAETPESSTPGSTPKSDLNHLMASEKKVILPSDGPTTPRLVVDSCVEDLQGISHTDVSVNPPTDENMTKYAD